MGPNKMQNGPPTKSKTPPNLFQATP